MYKEMTWYLCQGYMENNSNFWVDYLSCSILIVNRMCSVTNTECKPNIICQFLPKKIGHYRFTNVETVVTC